MPAALAVAWTRAAAAAAAATGCRHRSGDVRRWRRTARPPMARAGAIGCLTGFRLSKGEPVGCGRPVQRVGRAGARGRCGRRRSASAGAMRSKSGLSRRRCGTSLHPPCTLLAPSSQPPCSSLYADSARSLHPALHPRCRRCGLRPRRARGGRAPPPPQPHSPPPPPPPVRTASPLAPAPGGEAAVAAQAAQWPLLARPLGRLRCS